MQRGKGVYMNYLTAQAVGDRAHKLSLVVQHFEHKGEEICFACLGEHGEGIRLLYHWFRREMLGKFVKQGSSCAEKAEKYLRKQLRKCCPETEGENCQPAIAGVLCLGEAFIGFARGGMRLYCLNTAFGKGHLELLEEDCEGTGICSGTMQKNVAVLLAGDAFAEKLGEQVLAEGLFVGEMRMEWQMQKHLHELVRTASDLSVQDVGAILVRSCENGGKIDSEKAIGLHTEPDFGKVPVLKSHFMCGHFTWERLLGEGAFAQVYKVRCIQTGQIYACKRSEDIPMLWREYCVGSMLEHPLFPKIYDFWQEKGCGYLLMEYVPGTNVKVFLRHRSQFSVRQTIRVGMELAEGLLYLHEGKNPCLFRDVKPENIMIRQDGRVKLLDLGCACEKNTLQNTRAGSPGYAAPEQFVRGSGMDVTCDVYGLGKTLEEMLGRNRQHGVGKQLAKVCKQCTRENAEERIPDMRELLLMFARLYEKSFGNGPKYKNRCGGKSVYGKDLRCLKNIWERSEEIT